jgi:hypothetical protein
MDKRFVFREITACILRGAGIAIIVPVYGWIHIHDDRTEEHIGEYYLKSNSDGRYYEYAL